MKRAFLEGAALIVWIAVICITKTKLEVAPKCPQCEGCELIDKIKEGIEPEELLKIKFPAVPQGSPGTDPQRELTSVFSKFVSLVIGVSHLIPPPIGPYMRATQGIFTSILALAGIGKSDAWESIERQVEAKIESYFTYDHFNDLKSLWTDFQYIVEQCPSTLTKESLKTILKEKTRMFPQNNDHIQFTLQWVTSINSFLMYAVAVYLELIRQNKLQKCNLNEEMIEFRNDVVIALKSLQMKRWKAIRGNTYWIGVHYYSKAQYRDEITGDLFPTIKELFPGNDQVGVTIQRTESFTFDAIKKNTAEMIDVLRERFNGLVDVLKDYLSSCPQELTTIPKSASYLNYPKSCYGTSADDSDQCKLPCDQYGSNNYWCPSGTVMKYYSNSVRNGDDHGKIYSVVNWQWCTRATSLMTWQQCTPDDIVPVNRAMFFRKPWGKILLKKGAKKEKI